MSQSTVMLVSYFLLNYASSYKLTFLCPGEMSAARYHPSRYTFLQCLPPTEKWLISSSCVFPVRHGRAWYSMKQTFLSVFVMIHRNWLNTCPKKSLNANIKLLKEAIFPQKGGRLLRF